MVIHQVKERTGKQPEKPKPAFTLFAKCGYKVRLDPGDPQPPEFTIWTSEVTCEACL